MARLIISDADGKRTVTEVTKPLLTIGRSAANDVVLEHTSVSRYHGRLTLAADSTVSVSDCGSVNGITVNNLRIAEETVITEKDVIRIGVYEIRLEVPKEAAPLLIKNVAINTDIDDVLRGEASTKRQVEVAGASITQLNDQVRKLQRENFLLRMLYDAGKTLSSKVTINDILDEVLTLAFRIEGVERGFVTLLDESGQPRTQSEVRYRRPPRSDQPKIVLSRAILERIRAEMQPILILDMADDERFQASESLKISGLRSAMVAPLISGGWVKSSSGPEKKRMFGVFYVDNLERSSAFTQDEVNVFAVVATQAAAAIENALNRKKLEHEAVQRTALQRFVSPDVVEMIAANPHEIRLGGVSQKVTVVFADIRGFTSLSERMPPETVVELLNDYFTRVTDIIFDHGGMLDKYLGDGVMAVFGAPISKGNDAANAVCAAVEIQKLLLSLNRDAPARGWPELRVGIGINSGMAVAGNIGSLRRIDYTVVGDAVNVAARLMTNAAGGQILITDSTAAHLGGQFSLTPLPPLQVKGKAEALKVAAVNWLQASAAQG